MMIVTCHIDICPDNDIAMYPRQNTCGNVSIDKDNNDWVNDSCFGSQRNGSIFLVLTFGSRSVYIKTPNLFIIWLTLEVKFSEKSIFCKISRFYDQFDGIFLLHFLTNAKLKK